MQQAHARSLWRELHCGHNGGGHRDRVSDVAVLTRSRAAPAARRAVDANPAHRNGCDVDRDGQRPRRRRRRRRRCFSERWLGFGFCQRWLWRGRLRCRLGLRSDGAIHPDAEVAHKSAEPASDARGRPLGGCGRGRRRRRDRGATRGHDGGDGEETVQVSGHTRRVVTAAKQEDESSLWRRLPALAVGQSERLPRPHPRKGARVLRRSE
mmetsp:Transcript_43299/g.133756  ORF Transcript_43299/g.133756 Transcript_43299/m.133756 type:complete len:209 (-) Transcript_43299:1631-2257(-)